MKARLKLAEASPEGYAAMRAFSDFSHQCGLETTLVELVKIRASQINGCAFCLDMHVLDARAAGESEQRMHLVSVWRESPCFTARERAALAWCEALTRVAENEVPDALYAQMLTQFSERELVNLSLCIVIINGWNRLAKPFGMVPGHYRPPGAS